MMIHLQPIPAKVIYLSSFYPTSMTRVLRDPYSGIGREKKVVQLKLNTHQEVILTIHEDSDWVSITVNGRHEIDATRLKTIVPYLLCLN